MSPMPKVNSETEKFSKKISFKRGRRGRKNKLKLIPVSSIIYNNLGKPIKKVIPIAAVKPTVDTIPIDPSLEMAIEQRRSAIREDSRLIPKEFEVLLPREFDDSDAETVIVEPEVEIITLE